LAAADEKYPRLLAQNQQKYEAEARRVEERYRHTLADSEARHQANRDALANAWRDGLAQAQATVAAIGRETRRLFLDWADTSWNEWKPVSELPPAVRFGEFTVNLDQVPNGVPAEDAIKVLGPTSFTLPALLDCPEHCSMLFQPGDKGRGPAEAVLQMLMFRSLTALPPAKVRFTIVDPIGLGQSFAAFMHLADHDEQLVASRIWTEQQHIEQRLADLTAHMENVIQKYLRNQFRNIAEYNVHAGEVAEPFRFLVVENVPAGFTLEATRRLVSIAASGARCGVHTLVTVDPKLPLPQDFDLKDLEKASVTLVWKDGRYMWKDPDFGKFPF